MCTIQLGDGADRLTMQILGRSRPDSTDYWEANWLHCVVEAFTGSFHGKIDWQLRNEDLTRFLKGLECITNEAGQALLDTGDGWLEVRIVRDENGRVDATCEMEENPTYGNTLTFRLSLNQAVLPELTKQIRNVLTQFPVVGEKRS
jgi:hypothetical protein